MRCFWQFGCGACSIGIIVLLAPTFESFCILGPSPQLRSQTSLVSSVCVHMIQGHGVSSHKLYSADASGRHLYVLTRVLLFLWPSSRILLVLSSVTQVSGSHTSISVNGSSCQRMLYTHACTFWRWLCRHAFPLNTSADAYVALQQCCQQCDTQRHTRSWQKSAVCPIRQCAGQAGNSLRACTLTLATAVPHMRGQASNDIVLRFQGRCRCT